jgi:hypothetical protein
VNAFLLELPFYIGVRGSIGSYQPERYNFRPTLSLTTPPGARTVLRYVATHSPESFAESRFCLSRPFLFFGVVHEQRPCPIFVD